MNTSGKDQLQRRTAALVQLYDVFDAHCATIKAACEPGCSQCCTANVVTTTLEAWHLLQSGCMAAPAVHSAFARSARGKLLRPCISTNRMAEHVMAGENVPPEPAASPDSVCPLLTDDRCPAYAHRPLMCRCMLSSRRCRPGSQAEINDLFMSASQMCLQVVEHLDPNGCSGNLVDLMLLLSDPTHADAYAQGQLNCTQSDLAPNRPMPALMIAPEHQAPLKPMIQKIQTILVRL